MRGTDERTVLRIDVLREHEGYGATTLGSLTADGALNRLDLRPAALLGAGIDVTGPPNRLDFAAVSGEPSDRTAIRIGG